MKEHESLLVEIKKEDVNESKTKNSKIKGISYVYPVKRNPKGETQLHTACISGNIQLVEKLLAAGHPINVRDNAGWLPLHEACLKGRFEIAKKLIDKGADVNDRGGSHCNGRTPLYDAAINGHFEVVKLLIENDAIPTIETDFGVNTLQLLEEWKNSNKLTKKQFQACSIILSWSARQNFADKMKMYKIINKIIKPSSNSKHNNILIQPSTSKMENDSISLQIDNIMFNYDSDDKGF